MGQRGLEKDIGNDKRGHGTSNTKTVANIHGTVKEGRFNLIFGIAVSAAFVHFKKFGHYIRVSFLKHTLGMTFRATSC